VRCTKDACENHLCEKCGKCSDCCECEVTLDAAPRAAAAVQSAPADRPAENEAVVAREVETVPEAGPEAALATAPDEAATGIAAQAEAGAEPPLERG